MGTLRVAGAVCALSSCVPAWHGLAAIAATDYLGAALALGLAWILGRTGVELVAHAGTAGVDALPAGARVRDDLGA